ncbi:MAG: type 4a pilus biogenesis protein PilO [Acidimicrobiales bacterium]
MNVATRRIAAIAAGAAVVLLIIWYVAAWRPLSSQLHKAHVAHAAAQVKVQQLGSEVVTLQGLVKQVPADTARLAQLDANIPDTPQLDQALDQLHQVAVTSGVSLTTVGPSSPAAPAASGAAAPSGPPALTLTLSATGTQQQVMAFLASLATMPRTVVVDHLGLSGSNQVTASISARIFYSTDR